MLSKRLFGSEKKNRKAWTYKFKILIQFLVLLTQKGVTSFLFSPLKASIGFLSSSTIQTHTVVVVQWEGTNTSSVWPYGFAAVYTPETISSEK